ncbi:OLC1v1026549C1 [Oldenlandia corymbosa var. corymbosa]|uniref:OLC1v1026549C1 n=1 Tax=Oldenlandia corymbosa var. corymbosa TaxID=529605 RepID=A0AAV1C9J5_OLDCO|nr:OLC1v1026549C1 [Oldenlandia corymbosa var. corymbosa]
MDKFIPSLSPRIPLLMLARKGNSGECEFYHLSKKKVCMRLSIPEVIGKRCIEVRFGWLLTLTESGDVTLLNPFSRAQFKLPNIRTLPKPENLCYEPCLISIKLGVLSDNPSRVPNFTLMAIHCHGRALGFWRPGDVVWTKIEADNHQFVHANYYNSKFYVMDDCLNMWVWDEEEGKLLSIVRVETTCNDDNDDSDGSFDDHFIVLQMENKNDCWEMVNDIGGDALFLGYNAAISFPEAEAKRFGIKGNTIYFAPHFNKTVSIVEGGAKNMGIYNFKDGSTERFHGVDQYDYPHYGLGKYFKPLYGVDQYLNSPFWISSGN